MTSVPLSVPQRILDALVCVVVVCVVCKFLEWWPSIQIVEPVDITAAKTSLSNSRQLPPARRVRSSSQLTSLPVPAIVVGVDGDTGTMNSRTVVEL